MKLKLNRIEEPFVLELKNEQGSTCVIDAKSDIGGLNKGFRPMELLAGSLAACASIDVILILQKQKIKIIDYSVDIQGKRVDGIPSPFSEITLEFIVEANSDLQKVNRAIDLALNKYCSVTASLNDKIEIKYLITLK